MVLNYEFRRIGKIPLFKGVGNLRGSYNLSKGKSLEHHSKPFILFLFLCSQCIAVKKGFSISTHNGVKTEFHKSFVKSGIMSKQSGRTYSRLFNLRQEGDYMDFKRLEKEDIDPFFQEAREFIALITTLINS